MVGGIATGVALIVGISVCNATVLASFRNTLKLIAGPVDLQITLGLGEVGFPEGDLVDLVREDPDVEAVVPLVRGTVTLADDPAEALQLFGADLLAEQELQRYQISLVTDRTDASEALLALQSIFVTTTFGERHGLGLGDSLGLSTPRGIVNLTVKGLVKAEGLGAAYGGQLALMDIAATQWLLNKDRLFDQIDIRLRDGADETVVQARLQSAVPPTLTVLPPESHGMQYARVLSSFQAMLTGLSSLCLIVGLFIVYNSTSTAAIQRSASMAELRLVGAGGRRLFGLLMLEAAILGGIGSALGVLLGIPLAWLVTGTVTDSMGVIFQLRFPTTGIAPETEPIVIAFVLGILATLCASYFAARRMASLDLLEHLRSDRTARLVPYRVRGLLVAWFALTLLGAAAFVLEDRMKSIAWGNFGSTVWNASIIVIAIPLVQWVHAPVTSFLARRFGAAGRMAAGSLFRAGTRTGITVAAIALILTVAIMLSSLVLSCRESLRTYFAGVLAADLTVSAVSTEGGWLETPLPAELSAELAALPGVKQVDALRAISGQSYRGTRIALVGFSEMAFEPDRAPQGWYREGEPTEAASALQANRGAAVSVSFSDRFGLHLGDQVELESPTGLVRLPIVGVVPDYVSDRGSVIVNRQLLVERWVDARANRFLMFLQPNVSLDQVREAIQDRLGERYRLKVLSLVELLDYHTDLINRAFAVMNSVQLLIVIVTAVGIFDLLVSRILERQRELGLWRLIGAGRRSLTRSVMLEAGAIATMGAVLGIGVGILTAWIWIRVHFRHLLGYYVEYHFALGSAAWYAMLVMAMTVVAGVAAARFATNQSILAAIRQE